MPEIYRALIYVLLVAIPALYVARKTLRPFVDDGEISLWSQAWLFSTLAVFMSGSILTFSALIVGLSIYIHKRSRAPHYFFLVLLLTAPALGINIGIPGLIGSLTDLTAARIFSLAFLLPSAIRLLNEPRRQPRNFIDGLFWMLTGLMMLLSARNAGPTDILRGLANLTMDVVLPYYVFSRRLQTVAGLRTALSAFVFATLPFAASGAIEFARGWRIYNAVFDQWGITLVQAYLYRDGMLRASVTAVEAIAFGFVCMVAIGCLLGLRTPENRERMMSVALGVLVVGLICALSRGPWLGSILLVLIFATMTRLAVPNLVKIGLGLAIVCVPLMLSSAGERVYRLLPFVGSVETANEDYRAKLIEVSTAVIARNPFFGARTYLAAPEFRQMIQGQGIIDIVNTYVAIALEFGLVGLFLFLALFVAMGFSLLYKLMGTFGQDATLLRALMAILAAIGFTIATVSSVSFIPLFYWTFAGICVSALSLRMNDVIETEVTAASTPSLIVLGGRNMPPISIKEGV
jgi:hypothetical protein